MSQVKSLPCFPTLTDGLRAAPGAIVKAGPLGWANQAVSRLAAETQQALGFKFFPSETNTVGRHPWVTADSWTYTYGENRNVKLMYYTDSQIHNDLPHSPDETVNAQKIQVH